MSDKDNPFGGMGGQYSTNVSYGSAELPRPPTVRPRRWWSRT